MPYNYTLPTNVGLGASAGTATLGGVAHVNTTSAATTGTTEQILATYTLPANALSANGKGVRITAWGDTAANVNSKTFRVRFGGIGGTSLGAGTLTTASHIATITATVLRSGASAQLGSSMFHSGANAAGSVTPIITQSAPAQNETGTIDIVVTGTTPTAAGDLTFRALLVEWFN